MMMRKLGRSGISVRPLAFGCNVFGWTADAATCFQLLDAFVGAGFGLLDTADAYSRWVPGHTGGESESIIGEWLKRSGARNKVTIATKVGMEMGETDKGLSRAYIMRAVDRSLKRLNTEYIDIYFAHFDDAATPLAETLGAFAELIKMGKVRTLGASNYTAARLLEALKVSADNGLPRYEVLQPPYNLYDRNFEKELQPICAREEIGVMSYFALAAGFLSGKYRTEADTEGKVRGGRVKIMLNARGLRILDALDAVAAAHDTVPAQIALAWLVAKGITAPIASATNLEQLEKLTTFASIELGTDEIAALDVASAA